MEFLEKDLESIIYNAYQSEETREALIDIGLEIQGNMLRQLDLVGYGKADLVMMYFEDPENEYLTVNVIELKDVIDSSALSQACRYITGLKRYFEENKEFEKINIAYTITLIGKSISGRDDFVYLYNQCSELCDIYEYRYGFDGIYFKYIAPSYVRTNENLDIIGQKLSIDLKSGTIINK